MRLTSCLSVRRVFAACTALVIPAVFAADVPPGATVIDLSSKTAQK